MRVVSHEPHGRGTGNGERGTVEALVGTRLVEIKLSHAAWMALTAVTRRMLGVPLAWSKRKKGGEFPVRLRWHNRAQGGYAAVVVEGSAPATEVLAILAAAGVRPTKERGNHQLRRIPMGAIMTDPEGHGVRAHVETAGMPLLARTRRGRWKPYSPMGGSLWPKNAQEILGDWIAPAEGCASPAPVERNRYVIEEGTTATTLKRSVTAWKLVAGHATLEAARAALDERVAGVAKLALAVPPVWRVVDTGSRVTRTRVRLSGKNNSKIVRRDYDPACREKVEQAA